MSDTKDILIIGAVIVGAYVLFKGWKGITDWFGGIGEGVSNVFEGASTTISGLGDAINFPDTGSAVDLWKAGSGQQGYVYNYETGQIGYIDPNSEMVIPKQGTFPNEAYSEPDARKVDVSAKKFRKNRQKAQARKILREAKTEPISMKTFKEAHSLIPHESIHGVRVKRKTSQGVWDMPFSGR